MDNQKSNKYSLEDIKVNVKLKLAGLWSSLMFLYIYIDIFHFYMPGKMEDIMQSKVHVFEINPSFLLSVVIFMSIPALMVVFSIIAQAKINRIINLIIGALLIPFTLYNLSGEVWIHMILAAVIEVVLLMFILYYSWNWPKTIN